MSWDEKEKVKEWRKRLFGVLSMKEYDDLCWEVWLYLSEDERRELIRVAKEGPVHEDELNITRESVVLALKAITGVCVKGSTPYYCAATEFGWYLYGVGLRMGTLTDVPAECPTGFDSNGEGYVNNSTCV